MHKALEVYMLKKTFVIMVSLILCFLFSACTGKLTTIRPTLITRIAIENTVTGEKAELIRGDSTETDWLMDDLIFQMEQFFKAEGKCEPEDELYYVEYYFGDRLELSISINSDGSVCKDGKRYVQNEQGDNVIDRSVNLDKWAECFDIAGVK
jgi:hypothetical protein